MDADGAHVDGAHADSADSASAAVGLATEFTEAEQSPGLLLWQVTHRWQAAVRAALKPHGLTHVQFVLLASLAWLEPGGPVTQRQLADHAAADPMMTSQVIRALEQLGLVHRGEHPDDRRARALRVTPAGRALADRAVVAVEACDRRFFGVLQGETGTLAGLLRRLADQPLADQSPAGEEPRAGEQPPGREQDPAG